MKPLPSLKHRSARALVGLFSALVLFPFAGSCFAQLPVVRFVRDPDPAPEFKLKDLAGKELNLEASRGKVVLLNFWATWCGPCREEIPELIALQNRYKDRLQIIGLVVDDDDEKGIRSVMESEGINYPVALADPETRFAYGGIAALPTVFVINSEGRVVQKHVGLFNPALYETEVRALLGLPVAAKVETFQDEGDIFLKHADRAKILPGVDMSKLSPEQRDAALHKFNAESCTCGCKFTLAQCRIYDAACQISQKRTAEVIKALSMQESKQPPKDAEKVPVPASPPAPPEYP
ncbi:MAG TPA: TlpA disulfide reductase family protein [Candidatus Acidoferrales bacterium]|nr:TlpA disulfide reductase family protein [Candidatus Acidoferrales bacterium]